MVTPRIKRSDWKKRIRKVQIKEALENHASRIRMEEDILMSWGLDPKIVQEESQDFVPADVCDLLINRGVCDVELLNFNAENGRYCHVCKRHKHESYFEDGQSTCSVCKDRYRVRNPRAKSSKLHGLSKMSDGAYRVQHRGQYAGYFKDETEAAMCYDRKVRETGLGKWNFWSDKLEQFMLGFKK